MLSFQKAFGLCPAYGTRCKNMLHYPFDSLTLWMVFVIHSLIAPKAMYVRVPTLGQAPLLALGVGWWMNYGPYWRGADKSGKSSGGSWEQLWGKRATKAGRAEKLAPAGRQGHLAKGRAGPASVYTARAELGPRQGGAGVFHTQDPASYLLTHLVGTFGTFVEPHKQTRNKAADMEAATARKCKWTGSGWGQSAAAGRTRASWQTQRRTYTHWFIIIIFYWSR